MATFSMHMLDSLGNVLCGAPPGTMAEDDQSVPCADCLDDLDSVWVDVKPTKQNPNPDPAKINVNLKGNRPKGKEDRLKRKEKPIPIRDKGPIK